MRQKDFWVDISCSFKVKAENEETAMVKIISWLSENGGCYIEVSDCEEYHKL